MIVVVLIKNGIRVKNGIRGFTRGSEIRTTEYLRRGESSVSIESILY